MSEPQQEPFGFDSLKKLKIPSINSFLASKPNNVVSGAITGIGQTIGGAVVAVGEYLWNNSSNVSKQRKKATFTGCGLQCLILAIVKAEESINWVSMLSANSDS